MASPRRHAHSHRPTPSIPLPLPTRFAALPSRLPGKTLTPVLYTLINATPIYLTLSPSHEPHLSLLPLLLSLEPPIAPLQVLTACKLRQGDYSLDLNGEAPFVDLWAPFDKGRTICEYLGVSRLFWDLKDSRKGLLGEEVARAVSWDESHALGHNWLPSPSSLPPSSYSLSALMDTPFGSISVIPEDRCITTPIDRARRAHIISQALSEDKSTIRPNSWGAAWEALLQWTVQAWEAYLEHPKLSQPESSTSNLSETPPHTLLKLVPNLLSPNHPSYTPSLEDLRSATSPHPVHHTHWQVLTQLLWHLNPFYRPPPPSVQTLERQARINLGLVESVGVTMVAMWHARTIIENSHSADLVPRLVIECSHRDRTTSTGVQLSNDSSTDELDDLQEKRRSSPPRARRRVRRKSRSSPRVVHHAPRVVPRIAEKVDEWVDRVKENVVNGVERVPGGPGTSDARTLIDRTNGTSDAHPSVKVEDPPAWVEPTGDSTSIFDDYEDVAIANKPESVSASTHHELRDEILKTAGLPWWIIGTAITMPILSFMFFRSNWGIVSAIWTVARSTTQFLIRMVQFIYRHLISAWSHGQRIAVVVWQQRDRAREGVGTTAEYSHGTWIAVREFLRQVWMYAAVAYAWVVRAIGARKL